VVSSQIFWDEKTVDTVVDKVDIDALADLEGKGQEARESWWDTHRDEAFLDRKLSPGTLWSRLGLSEDRERSGNSRSLCWGKSRHTRLAGDKLAVWVLVVDTIIGKGDS
jgi:hypothetical protein